MSKRLSLGFNGLMTVVGNSKSPPGGLTTAQNVNFPAPNIATKSRGHKIQPTQINASIWEIQDEPLDNSGLVYAQAGTGLAPSTLWLGDGVGAWTSLLLPDSSSVEGASNSIYRTRRAALNGVNYFTGSNGVTRVPIYNPTNTTYAGVSKSPGFDTARATGVLTFLAGFDDYLINGNAVAYRCLWGYRDDSTGKAIEYVGAPSGRSIVANVAGTPGFVPVLAQNVFRRLTIPTNTRCQTAPITTDWFFRVYRSAQVDYATSIPSDEMQLCYEANVTAGDIAAGFVEFVDVCPEAALGAYLYTNTISGGDIQTGAIGPNNSSVGIAAQNDLPPVAREVAEFAGCLFYLNLLKTPTQTLSLISVPPIGDAITINGATYTAVAGAPANTSEFTAVTGGTISQNIQATALNLVEAINADSANNTLIIATYTGNDSSPGTTGQFILELKGNINSTPNIVISASTSIMEASFLPKIPTTGLESTSEIQTNGFCVSKPHQGEAVPPANYFSIGPSSCSILAAIPLRQGLFIFTDVGIYLLRGDNPSNFSFDLFDPTFRLWGQRGAAALGDEIYAWGREGIISVTSGGTRTLDTNIRDYVRYIEKQLGFDTTRNVPYIADYFALPYRVEQQVFFFYPDSNQTRNCSKALVWNMDTSTWSTRLFAAAKSCGVARAYDEIGVFGEWNSFGADSSVFVERNSGALTDFSDDKTNGQTQEVVSVLEWNYQAPDLTMLQFWRELTVDMSPSLVDPILATLPFYCLPAFQTEVSNGYQGTSLSISSLSARIVIPGTASTGVRMGVRIQHIQVNQYFAISGCTLLYEPISQTPTR